ncbi:MAG TPA: NUDIX hydrolase [Elusimicrobia bacterium]|nr:NUDIX hydrolase [Elusimicrobiota bacterium]
MSIATAIKSLERHISDPRLGLPEEVFFFVSRLTPMVNVDLLVKDEKGRTLLAWRNDRFSGMGWHLPGGIVRFKEKLENRVMKVAEAEIGASVNFDPAPVAINQFICGHDTRGHFISLLYKCSISGGYAPPNEGLSPTDEGYLRWHGTCPKNLLKVHEIYRKHICQ